MSSSEEYLDSLLESILTGGKSDNTAAADAQQDTVLSDVSGEVPQDSGNTKSQAGSTNTNKAMSEEEIQEMLMSMGTLKDDGKSSLEVPDHDQTDELPLDDLALEDFGQEETGTEDIGMDGLGMEEGQMSDLSLDDLALEDFGQEETGTEDIGMDGLGIEEGQMSDLSLDDFALEDFGQEETGTEDIGVDGLGMDGLGMEEGQMSDLSLDDFALEDFGQEETGTEDIGMDGLGMEEGQMSDLSLDDFALEDFGQEETGTEDIGMDGLGMEEGQMSDLSLDDFALEDFGQEETGTDDSLLDSSGDEGVMTDDLSLDDFALEDFGMEESLSDDFSMDDLNSTQGEEPLSAGSESLDDLMADMGSDFSLDDLSLEEEQMSEEDIDRLLNGVGLESDNSSDMDNALAFSDDFALEEADGEDDDLSALLAGMGHDEDLSEINDLLEKSENGVSADDDMLAMLGDGDNNSFDFFADDNAAKEAASIREISPEELEERENSKGKKEKKKRLKKEKKSRKKKGTEAETQVESAVSDELESLLGNEQEENKEEPKKQGFGAKLMALLFEGDDDEKPADGEGDEFGDDGLQMGNLTDENKEILQELSEEDKKNSKKKGKKDKKKKKGKKGKGDAEDVAAEGEEGEEGEEKEKKPKKRKKKKKEETEEELLAPPEKKLSKKKVISVFLFCGTIAACIILITSFLPTYMQKQDARIAYDHGYYGDVYDLLYGKELAEEDEALFQKSSLILQMDRKLNSYENYNKMGMRLEALDALISGVSRYQSLLPKAEQYNVVGEVRNRYDQIIEKLSADFGVSEMDVLDIIASEDDVTYSQKLQAVINGTLHGGSEDLPEIKQDVLPEEEEIISRLEGVEADDLQVSYEQEDNISTEESLNDMDAEQADGSDN